MFKLITGKGHPEFSTEKQQDAAEYLRHVFTMLQVPILAPSRR